jgi:hypothetical protein
VAAGAKKITLAVNKLNQNLLFKLRRAEQQRAVIVESTGCSKGVTIGA